MEDHLADPLVWRSLLYVPANSSRFIERAHSRGADGIILDLEDSVPAAERDAARQSLAVSVEAVGAGGADVLLRINSDDESAAEDLDAGIRPGVSAVLVTKARDEDHLRTVGERVRMNEVKFGMTTGTVRLVPMIETATAYFRALEIGRADPRNAAMMLGGEDFAMDMGAVPGADTLAVPKQHVAIAARAAGLMPLGLMGTVADFTDLDGIRTAAETASRFGFEGASCIHPSNVPVLNAVFTPSAEDVSRARRALAGYNDALAAGRGAVTVDGKMIDAPVAVRAENLLRRADAIAAKSD